MGAGKGLTQPLRPLELGHHLHSGPGAGGRLSPALPPKGPTSHKHIFSGPQIKSRKGSRSQCPTQHPPAGRMWGGQPGRASVQSQFRSREGPRPGAGQAPVSPKDSRQHTSPGRAYWPQPGIYPHTAPKGRSYKIHILGKTAQTEGVTGPRSHGGRAAVRTPRWHGTGWSHPPTAPPGQGLPSRLSPRT